MDRGIVLWTVALALLAVAVGSAGVAGAADGGACERSIGGQAVGAAECGDGSGVILDGRRDRPGDSHRWFGGHTANGTATDSPDQARATPDDGSDPLGPVALLLVLGAVGGVVGAGLLIARNE